MPTTRTRRRRVQRYAPAIDALIAGEPIEHNEDNESALAGILFFGEHPGLPVQARARAAALLEKWADDETK